MALHVTNECKERGFDAKHIFLDLNSIKKGAANLANPF